MNKTQTEKNGNEVTQKEFDRSVCMSFFNDHRELVKRIERLHGVETAYKIQNLIIDYGLDGVMPTDETLLQYVPEPVLNQIDQNQQRRSKGFKGEDLEVSRSIIVMHRDHPELSQNAIAKQLGVSKGKVNKTLKKYENGEYEGIINFNTFINTDINTYTNTSTITNTTATVTSPSNTVTSPTVTATNQKDQSLQSGSQTQMASPTNNSSDLASKKKTYDDFSEEICEQIYNKYNCESTIKELTDEYNTSSDVIWEIIRSYYFVN